MGEKSRRLRLEPQAIQIESLKTSAINQTSLTWGAVTLGIQRLSKKSYDFNHRAATR